MHHMMAQDHEAAMIVLPSFQLNARKETITIKVSQQFQADLKNAVNQKAIRFIMSSIAKRMVKAQSSVLKMRSTSVFGPAREHAPVIFSLRITKRAACDITGSL
jgi:hypothetical protein